MKLTRLDRAAIALYVLLNMLALAFVFACAIAPDFAEAAGCAFHATMLNYPLLRVLLIAVCVVLAVLICGEAWVIAHGRGQETEAQPVALSADESGSVQIARGALEALVRRSVGPVDGVDKFDVKLDKNGEALDVTLQVSVRQGVKIPELAREAQQNVREALEGMTGAQVENVSLLVTEITQDAAQPQPPAGKD